MMHCRNCRSVIFENDIWVRSHMDSNRKISALIKWLSQMLQKYGITNDLSTSGAGVCLSCLKFMYTGNNDDCAVHGNGEESQFVLENIIGE